jgi:glutamate-5-semialdehyde dehydrogenase
MALLNKKRANLKTINQQDINNYSGDDWPWKNSLWLKYPKLTVILSMQQLASRRSVGVERLISITRKWNKIINKTAFGTIMIIYESRLQLKLVESLLNPNKIFIENWKKRIFTINLKIVELWHQALTANNVATEWVEYLNYVQSGRNIGFLEKPTQKIGFNRSSWR